MPINWTFPLHRKKRETGIEPATFALARRRSTTEPLAQIQLLSCQTASGQNRTGDTRIFSPLLYQLSYRGSRLLEQQFPSDSMVMILLANGFVNRYFEKFFDFSRTLYFYVFRADGRFSDGSRNPDNCIDGIPGRITRPRRRHFPRLTRSRRRPSPGAF